MYTSSNNSQKLKETLFGMGENLMYFFEYKAVEHKNRLPGHIEDSSPLQSKTRCFLVTDK